MPGMMPPAEKLPIEKALESAEKKAKPSTLSPSLSFCQSVAPLVTGQSSISFISSLLDSLVDEVAGATSRGELFAAIGCVPKKSLGVLFPRWFKALPLSSYPESFAGLAGFPGKPLKEVKGFYFANEKPNVKTWVLHFDYQPNSLGFLLALCLRFSAGHRFYLSSLPHLFPRFDEENLAELLLEDKFKNIKVESPRPPVVESLKSGVFPRVKAFVPGPIWEDLVGEHLSSWNPADFEEKWALADSVDKINRSWHELDGDYWKKCDTEYQRTEYCGYKISVLRPNGGIISVSVFDGNNLWSLSSEIANFFGNGKVQFNDADKHDGKLFTD
jgi:hypothetical protein